MRGASIGVSNAPTNEYRDKVSGTYTDISKTAKTIVKYIIPEEFTMYSPCIWVMNGHSGTYSEVIVYNVWLE